MEIFNWFLHSFNITHTSMAVLDIIVLLEKCGIDTNYLWSPVLAFQINSIVFNE